MNNPRHIEFKLPYLRRDSLYLKERPYTADFPVEKFPGAQPSNHLFDYQDTIIEDAQPRRKDFTLEKNGFCFIRSKTSIMSTHANDNLYVEGEYFDQLEDILHRAFPEYERIEYLDHLVSDSFIRLAQGQHF